MQRERSGSVSTPIMARFAERASSRPLVGGALLCAFCAGGCAVTSPHWGYVPASTEAPIPVQAWTAHTGAPVVVECATDTTAHGSPYPDESAYIVAASLPVSGAENLDAEGAAMHTASGMVSFPSDCWEYFGSYDFWQLNLRVSQIQPASEGGTTKRIFSSFDVAGLECLGRENGAAASWFGFLGKGCEKTYLGQTNQIPYIVLRIEGHAAGLGRASTLSKRTKLADREPVKPDVRHKDAARLTPIVPLSREEIERYQKAAGRR